MIDAAPKKPRLAFLVARAGRDVAGGAEYIALMLAERLAAGFDVDIVTSTSRALVWDDHLPPREDIVLPHGRVRILRFVHEEAVDAPGDPSIRDIYAAFGPNLPAAERYMEDNYGDYIAVMCFGYLFNTTYIGASLAGKLPTICVPYLHDEPLSRYWLQALVLDQFDHMIFQTPEEVQYYQRLFGAPVRSMSILGSGVVEELAEQVNATPAMRDDPYFVYVGRLDQGKNVQSLVDMFAEFERSYSAPGRQPVRLKVIGKSTGREGMELPECVVPLGFLSEEEKYAVIRDSICLINPSLYESLSMVVLEAWAVGTPVLVNKQCEVLDGQVRRSAGGLSYGNFGEFSQALCDLLDGKVDVDAMGQAGRAYYRDNYAWDHLTAAYTQAVYEAVDAFATRAGERAFELTAIRDSSEVLELFTPTPYVPSEEVNVYVTASGRTRSTAFMRGYFWGPPEQAVAFSPAIREGGRVTKGVARIGQVTSSPRVHVGTFALECPISDGDMALGVANLSDGPGGKSDAG